MADRHTEDKLVWGLIASIALVLCGLWVAFGSSGMPPGIGFISSALFGAFGLGWAYALKLKRATLAKANKPEMAMPRKPSD